MKCYNCGAELTKESICQNCGIQIKVYKKLLYTSNACYNLGLERAEVRDLSGAIEALQMSLKYNKMNTDARNLLGLIYYEMGEVVDALGEWVISKSLQPEQNEAEHYIDEIQKNQAQLDTVNQTIKKYNQALQYCSQGSEDLAVIQLKKVLTMNPKLVKGHQLLGLLYIQQGELDKAKKCLRQAGRIDANNTTTLHYLREVNGKMRADGKKEIKDSRNDESVQYKSGNDTIIQPAAFKDHSSMTTVINILVGVVVGVLVTWFLVVPGVKQSLKSDANSAVIEANDTITTKDDNIKSLESKVADLNTQIEELQGNATKNDSVVSSYEQLLVAYQSYVANEVTAAGTALGNVNQDYLSDTAKAIYTEINTRVNADYLQQMYTEGESAYNNLDYATAITDLTAVVGLDEGYRDGYAVYYLAQSYRKSGDNANAKTYYEKVIELYPGTQRASTSQTHLDQINADLEAAGDTTGDAANGTGTGTADPEGNE